MAHIKPVNAYDWPPHPERTVNKEITVICQDLRTAALFVLEAFDLSDKGLSIPYYRRQMSALNKVMHKQGIIVTDILREFSKEEQYDIYPALSQELMIPLIEELEVLGYVEIKEGQAFVTKKGEQSWMISKKTYLMKKDRH